METPDLIGSAETARMLGVQRSTVTRRVAAGALAPLVIVPGYRGDFLFDRAEIEARAEQQS
ncbi:helix-turn-helix domain-containing protein [Microbacterium allomyrinae]|uniref:Helix-turn-helix domain-containing protein n=1 Tax=Microbacterium allomyrinae TaxID=2830666 RepID=A0A9X1LXH4_9MICO|nr:helix-turn-helix domain-containing protein [Microbacterium allomyrinae]MCC2033894.1 hypothetical protein [Microbacterium allomyrinae]